jgi:hypothetical protein
MIKATPQKGAIKPNTKQTITIESTVPKYQANGRYEDTLIASISDANTKGTLTLNPSLAIPVSTIVYGKQQISAEITGISVDVKENGIIETNTQIKNTGDVSINPAITFEIAQSQDLNNPENEPFTAKEKSAAIIPGSRSTHKTQMDLEDSEEGEYTVKAELIYDDETISQKTEKFTYTLNKEHQGEQITEKETVEEDANTTNLDEAEQQEGTSTEDSATQDTDETTKEADETTEETGNDEKKEDTGIVGKASAFFKKQQISLLDTGAFIGFILMLTVFTILVFRNDTKTDGKKRKRENKERKTKEKED